MNKEETTVTEAQYTRKVPREMWLNPKDLKIDPAYQRRVKQPAIDEMVNAGWREDLAGFCDVSLRPNGDMVVVDGQHRVLVARHLGVDRVRVILHEGLTLDDEAQLWVDLNTRRSRPKVIDIFNARLVANDEVALAVREAIAEAGAFVPRHSGSIPWPGIQAVDACERVYRAGGKTLLVLTLRTLLASWPDDQLGLRGYLIHGVAAVHFYYAGHPNFSREKLIERLARTPARFVYQRGIELATAPEGGPGTVSFAYPGHRRAVVATYNKGAQRQLPDLNRELARDIARGDYVWPAR